MNILVLLKQVPNVSEITIDPQTLAIDRSRAVQVLNPEDLHALEAGLTLASQKQGSVTVLSMGPERCEAVLREGIGMGATNAVRVTDDSFVGSDTLMTADVLKAAINHLGKFDAIFCGANSIDGNTSQIAGKLGAMLNIGTLTNASSIEFKEDEIEIARFITRTGADLRNDYNSFSDLRRDFNLLEIINQKYSSKNERGTLHPKILEMWALEASTKENLDIFDVNFVFFYIIFQY